jgi:hypothetical protein
MNSDTDPDDALYEIRRTAGGAGVMLPSFVERLSGDALEAYADLQRAAVARHQLLARIEALVGELRGYGASWAAIGWALGVSSEAARLRWNPEQPQPERRRR